MNASLLLKTVIAQIGRYRLRSALMVAAIGFGVLTTAAIGPFADGVRRSFSDYMSRLYPADVVMLASDALLPGGYADNLRLADIEAVRATIPDILDWDPLVRVGGRDLRDGERTTRVGITGHSERAEAVRRRSVTSGEFFSRADVDRRARVALIGETTATRLFGDRSPLGVDLFIDDRPFEVIGVLEPFGMNPHGADLDHTIWIPYTTAMDELLAVEYVSEVALAVADTGRMDAVAERASAVMRERHAIPDGHDDDFDIVTPVAVGAMLERVFGTLDVLTGSVVAIVFTLGALVVLGVMLIGIRQRASEIGLRKAFGARAVDLEVQIAIEVLVIAAIASLAGLAAAALTLRLSAPFLADQLGMTDVTFSASSGVLAVAAAALAALVGALLPAMRAARLDPVRVLK
jgi:putative ABC transport system permease protein